MSDFLKNIAELHLPPLRHLLWLSQAPQLISGPRVFEPKNHLTSTHWEDIQGWDASASLPERLTAYPQRLLGLYVEELYHCLLEDLFGWTILARNLPIYSGKRTIGEMDFLLRNPQTGKVEHHEIAIKFYLAHGKGEKARWYGPNSADRLDLKTDRMLNHQSQLSLRPEARTVLDSLGIGTPIETRLFMPGYLFYPLHNAPAPPEQVPADHSRGIWLFADELAPDDCEGWVPLNKPHWLGPWLQTAAPDKSLTANALSQVEADNRPRLFAQLMWDESYQLWIEQQRYFVMPRRWPENMDSSA